MKTVILLDGWIFRGTVEESGSSLVILGAECLAHGAGKWEPSSANTVRVPVSSVVAIME